MNSDKLLYNMAAAVMLKEAEGVGDRFAGGFLRSLNAGTGGMVGRAAANATQALGGVPSAETAKASPPKDSAGPGPGGSFGSPPGGPSRFGEGPSEKYLTSIRPAGRPLPWWRGPGSAGGPPGGF